MFDHERSGAADKKGGSGRAIRRSGLGRDERASGGKEGEAEDGRARRAAAIEKNDDVASRFLCADRRI